MSVNLTSLSRKLLPSLPQEREGLVRSVCDKQYDTPKLAHDALKGLCGRLRAAGVLCNTFPILTIVAKMSALQAEVNRAAVASSIDLAEHKISGLQLAIKKCKQVRFSEEGEAELPEVVSARACFESSIMERIEELQESLLEAWALMPKASSSSNDGTEAPAPKRQKIDSAAAASEVQSPQVQEGSLRDHLRLMKINKTYARLCSLLALGTASNPAGFSLSGETEIPNAWLLRLHEDNADSEWYRETDKTQRKLSDLAMHSYSCCEFQSKLNERINEIGFRFR